MARRVKKSSYRVKKRGVRKTLRKKKAGKFKRRGAGRKLSVKSYTARAPFGDKAYATLKFVSSANMVPTLGGLGIVATSLVFNDLGTYVTTFGLAPGVIDYSNIFFDYRILNVKYVLDFYPSAASDPGQVMYGWEGQLPLASLNYKELLEKNFVQYKNVATAGSGMPTRMVYRASVRDIDSSINLKIPEYSGVTSLSTPYAASPTEIVRFSCGLSSVAPAGYSSTSSQGIMKIDMYVNVVYWNRRQQSHV